MVEFILHFLGNIFIIFILIVIAEYLEDAVAHNVFKTGAKGEAFFIYTAFIVSLLILTYLVDIKAVPFLINLILR